MNEHGLSLFHLEKKDFNIKLKKGGDLEALQDLMSRMPAAPVAAPVAAAAPAAAAPGAGDAAPEQEGEAIESPMVGTFYGKPSPDADDFVSVGDAVKVGDTLCIIEAMKVMNEIKAEKAGTIIEICAEDSTPVQYGDELFRIK